MQGAAVPTREMVINNVLGTVANYLVAAQIAMVEAAMREALKDVELSVMCTALTVDLDDNAIMINNFLASKKMEGIKDSTLRAYGWAIRKFFREVNKNYKDVTKNDVKLWLMKRTREVSRNCVINYKRNLQSYYNWLTEEGYVQTNPVRAIKTMKELQPENIHMTIEEETMVRDYICRESVCVKHRAIISLLLCTGMRVGEVESLNRTDVNFSDGSITFRGEKSDRIRTVFLDVRAKLYLTEYIMLRKDNHPALFVTWREYKGQPKRLRKSRYETITKRICAAAGVVGKSCTVHVFRRTFATRLADRGCPLEVIQELLGHANSDTTSRCYVARSSKRVKDRAAQYLGVA